MPTPLVVEDDDSTRMTLFETPKGTPSLSLGTGWRHVHRIRPCVIVLDLMMPVMDGIEFRRAQLRQREQISSIPVVCVTAVAWLAESLGLPCLRNPVDLDELVTPYGHSATASRRWRVDPELVVAFAGWKQLTFAPAPLPRSPGHPVRRQTDLKPEKGAVLDRYEKPVNFAVSNAISRARFAFSS